MTRDIFEENLENPPELKDPNQKNPKTPEERKNSRYNHLKSLLTKLSRLKAEAIQIMHKLNYSDDVISRTINNIQSKASTEETTKEITEEVEVYEELTPLRRLYLENVLMDTELRNELKYLIRHS